jgi:fimbrial chaperone protein
MQVRIVRWKQEDGHERYTAQQDVVASPPIVTIGTGSKQLIRLIKQARFPQGSNRPTALSWMKFPSLMPKLNPPSASNCRCVTPFLCLCMDRDPDHKRGAHHALVETKT